jgi:hypothetical protein
LFTIRNRPPRRLLLGLLLVVPGFVALIFAYVVPTVWTVTTSFYHFAPFLGDRWAGSDNYRTAFETGFGHTVVFALWIGLLPALLAVVVSLPLAVAAHRAGTAARRVTRAVIAVPLAVATPAGFAAGWWLLAREAFIGDNGPRALWWAVFATTGGLAFGVGITLYLAALQRPEPGRSARPAVALVGVLAIIAAVGLALQLFTVPFSLTSGRHRTATPLLAALDARIDYYRPTAMETMLLVALGVLGVLATVLVIATRARLEVGPTVRVPATGRITVIGTVMGLVVVVLATGLELVPWLMRLGDKPVDPSDRHDAAMVFVNTWGPPVLSTVVGVGLALVAAIGIGAVRPFGRASEGLLLPFAPWLLVGSGPLHTYTFDSLARAGAMDSWLGLVPRTWVVIPALFVLTLLLRGQRARWDRLRASGQPASLAGNFVLPVLPMVALLAGVTWLVQAQDVLRQIHQESVLTGPVLAWHGAHRVGTPLYWVDLGLALPPVLAVVLVLAAIALQLAYLDRLALRVGEPAQSRPHTPRRGSGSAGEPGGRPSD